MCPAYSGTGFFGNGTAVELPRLLRYGTPVGWLGAVREAEMWHGREFNTYRTIQPDRRTDIATRHG